MSVLDREQPVVINVGGCRCSGTPHTDGDEVYLKPEIGLEGGLVAEQQLLDHQGPNTQAEATALTREWALTFVRYGAYGWNLVDAEGEPRPFDIEEVLGSYSIGRTVADAAADLYGDQVMRPLMKALPKALPRGSGTSKTSRTPRSTKRQRGSSSPASLEASPPSAA